MDLIQDTGGFDQRLSALPVELPFYILHCLPKPYLKALRFKYRKFELVVSGYLFHTLSYVLRKRQLRVFAHVASHPVLSRYLKHTSCTFLRYGCFACKIPQNRVLYIEDIQKESSLCNCHATGSLLQYQNLYDDERQIIKANEEARVLVMYLPKLQNLHHVSASFEYTGPYRWSSAPSREPQRPLPMLYHNLAGCYLPGEPLQHLFRMINRAGVNVNDFCLTACNTQLDRRGFIGLYGNHYIISTHRFFASLTSVDVVLPSAASSTSSTLHASYCTVLVSAVLALYRQYGTVQGPVLITNSAYY